MHNIFTMQYLLYTHLTHKLLCAAHTSADLRYMHNLKYKYVKRFNIQIHMHISYSTICRFYSNPWLRACNVINPAASIFACLGYLCEVNLPNEEPEILALGDWQIQTLKLELERTTFMNWPGFPAWSLEVPVHCSICSVVRATWLVSSIVDDYFQ